jgi:hypothetical protein
MNYSLINVSQERNGLVDGVWMQDCTGVTLEEAKKRARDAERVNSNRNVVAVVESLNYSCPDYNHQTGLKRLG